jgi:hypothetical protein
MVIIGFIDLIGNEQANPVTAVAIVQQGHLADLG